MNKKMIFTWILFLSLAALFLPLNLYIPASSLPNNSTLQYRSKYVSFIYPANFSLTTKNFPGGEIIFHADLQKKDFKDHAIIQVWKMQKPLKSFLDNSLSTSLQNYTYSSFSPVKVNSLQGYLWEYVINSNNTPFNALEIFLQKGDRMYRVSYFAPRNQWTKDNYNTFWEIVNSLKPSKV